MTGGDLRQLLRLLFPIWLLNHQPLTDSVEKQYYLYGKRTGKKKKGIRFPYREKKAYLISIEEETERFKSLSQVTFLSTL